MKRLPTLTKRERKAANVPENQRFTIMWRGVETVVPYVAAWSSELPNFRVAPDPFVGNVPALFRGSGRRGEGKPMLGKMDVARQRLCVEKRLCQVCASPLQGLGWCVHLEELTHLEGTFVQALSEPAACARCMATALMVCPGLERRRPRPPIVRPARITKLMQRMIPPPGGFGLLPAEDPKARYTMADTVLGYLKIVIDEVEEAYSFGDFKRVFEAGLVQ
jgi:hypothetical protein